MKTKNKKFINTNFQDNEMSFKTTNGISINTSKCLSRLKIAIGCMLVALLFISGCVLQGNPNIAKNSSSQTNTSVNTTTSPTTENTTTNNTPVVEPPEPILLPVDDNEPILLPVDDKFAIYIIDNDKKGSYILTSNKQSMLINSVGGSDGLRLLKIIKNLRIINLDKFIITNNHDDNIAGAPQIILRANPSQLIHSGIPSVSSYYKQYNLLYTNATILPSDTIISFDDSLVYLIVSYDDGSPLTSDSSVVVKVSYGNSDFLFSTDCAIDCESRISNIRSDVLISNGGCDSLSLSFLKQVSPDVIIFSGKPCPETLERARSLAIPVLTTQSEGDITITSDGIDYEYKNLKSK